MASVHKVLRGIRCAAALLVLAACSDDMEHAQKLISDIDTRVRQASPEAALYAPERLREVRGRLDALRAAFERDDYAQVVADGPGVLGAAQALGGASAARRNAMLKVLSARWTALTAAVPKNVAAIDDRIDRLDRKAGRKTPGDDLDAARIRLSDEYSLWSKAQAAFAAGNMEEAVATADTLESRLGDLAASLNLALPAPGAAANRPAP